MSSLRRRLVSISGIAVAAVVLVILLPIWLPVAALSDLVRGRLRLPTVRLLAFGLCWSWLELSGVAAALFLWLTGRGRSLPRHYGLQRWWAARLLQVMKATTGLSVTAKNVEALTPGPTVMLCRHASLADSLVSAYVVTTLAGRQPRYVLKRELQSDPCLDILGSRLPNHFLDRTATDSRGELDALTRLAAGMSPNDVAIIFPEGTRAAPKKRESALRKIGSTDPARAEKMAALQHLLPPRPAGAAALLAGAPDADVVIAWHAGFDGLDTFGGILRAIAKRPRPVQFELRRIPRAEVPTGDGFVAWLDDTWLGADRAVHQLLEAHP